jgi:hypothetical protein
MNEGGAPYGASGFRVIAYGSLKVTGLYGCIQSVVRGLALQGKSRPRIVRKGHGTRDGPAVFVWPSALL